MAGAGSWTKPGSKSAVYTAVRQWLATGIKLSDANPGDKELLNSAADLVAVSVEYIIECEEEIRKGRYPSASGLAKHLAKRSLLLAALSGSQQVKCVAAIFDVAMDTTQTVRVAAATPALLAASGGIGSVFLVYSAICLACSALDMVEICSPALKELLRDARRKAVGQKLGDYYLYRLEQRLKLEASGQMIA